MKVNSEIYLRAMKSSLEKICFDKASGDFYEFSELFYPLDLAEGKVAFQGYSAQMDRVHKLSDERKKSGYGIERDHSTDVARMFVLSNIQKMQARLAVKMSYETEAYSEPSEGSDASLDNKTKIIDKESIGEKAKLQRQILSEEDLAYRAMADEEQDVDLLLEDPHYGERGGLIVDIPQQFSRILAVASAGYGKTTLLRRVALFYCERLKGTKDTNRLIKKKYSLSGDYIPCIIRLRDLNDNDFSVDKAIENSVVGVLETWCANEEIECCIDTSQLQDWIKSVKSSLLLLIDGLDELSDKTRLDFLISLNEYLQTTPETHVILTSRVAGLSEYGVKDILKKMKFRGRSIIPLSDDEAKKYAQKWISATQPEEQCSQLYYTLDQILTQRRYKYLKEFMRTPLELIVILKQMVSATFSLDRFRMFCDMLWEFFTNHEKRSDRKGPVFDDTMTILSFIAYKMQLKDSLYISITELSELLDELGDLSFQTDIVENGTLEEYVAFLDDLAANVGIIEKDDRSDGDAIYTFPIRAYQEFLTAHACCHLVLLEDSFKPAPRTFVNKHIDDTRWLNIINFILSDLGANNRSEFDLALVELFAKISDIEQLQSLVEADLPVTITHAQVLCGNMFAGERLKETQKELLLSCLNSKQAYAYVHVLKAAYSNQNGSSDYLEASAISSVVWDYNSGGSALKTAIEALQKEDANEIKLGTMIVSILATSLLDEGLGELWGKLKLKVSDDLVINDVLLEQLVYNAKENRDVSSVVALVNLWLTRLAGTAKIRSDLTVELAKNLIEEIDKNKSVIQKLCILGMDAWETPEYFAIKDLIYALGTLPIKSEQQEYKEIFLLKNPDIFISSFMQSMYNKSCNDLSLDQVAIAKACFLYCWDVNQFIEAWGADICKSRPSKYVRKVKSCKREQHHFEFVRNSFVNFEQAYMSRQEASVNVFGGGNNEFALFRAERYLEAARLCLKNNHDTNLAFLMRYGGLNGDEIAEGKSFDLAELLKRGVNAGESYALVNMALYEASQDRIAEAMELFGRLTSEDWDDVSRRFWYPELWVNRGDAEGALVCVLAHQWGGCKFDDYQDMLKCAKESYPLLITKELII